MRLVDVLPDFFHVSPYLMELNILNAAEAKKKVSVLSKRVKSPKHRQWFQSALYKSLVNQSGLVKWAKDSEDRRGHDLMLKGGGLYPVRRLSKDSAPWARAEMEKGGELYRIKMNREVLYPISDVIRWLNTAIHPDKNINMGWSDAYIASQEWKIDQREKKARREEMREGEKLVHKYRSGYRWVELTTLDCVRREGETMQNCLSSPNGHYLVGHDRIYSLRDKSGKPLVTLRSIIEEDNVYSDAPVLDDWKAKGNQTPSSDYYPYVLDLMYRKGIEGFPNVLVDVARELGYFISKYRGLRKLKDLNMENVMKTKSGKRWVKDDIGLNFYVYYLLETNDKPIIEVKTAISTRYSCNYIEQIMGYARKNKPKYNNSIRMDIMELMRKEALRITYVMNYDAKMDKLGVPSLTRDAESSEDDSVFRYRMKRAMEKLSA